MKYFQNFMEILYNIQRLKLWNIIVGGFCAIVSWNVTFVIAPHITQLMIYHDVYTTNIFVFIFLFFFSYVVMSKLVSASIRLVETVYHKMRHTQNINSIIDNTLSLYELLTILQIVTINKLKFSDKKIRNHVADLDSVSLQSLCRLDLIDLSNVVRTEEFSYIPVSFYTVDERDLKIFIQNKDHIIEMILNVLKTKIAGLLDDAQITRLLDFSLSHNVKDCFEQNMLPKELEIINEQGLFINSFFLIKSLEALKN